MNVASRVYLLTIKGGSISLKALILVPRMHYLLQVLDCLSFVDFISTEGCSGVEFLAFLNLWNDSIYDFWVSLRIAV